MERPNAEYWQALDAMDTAMKLSAGRIAPPERALKAGRVCVYVPSEKHDRMTAHQWDALRLRVRGTSYAEIAHALGLGPPSVHGLVTRAVQHLIRSGYGLPLGVCLGYVDPDDWRRWRAQR